MRLITAYDKYTSDTEPPTNYHVWTLIACISALLGRKCYVPQGIFTVYPNLYIVLVGSPGMKKSTSMNVGKELLKEVGRVYKERGKEDFPLAPSSMTREALLQSLSKNVCKFTDGKVTIEYHQISAFVTEFQEFIGGKHRNASMIDILTAIWDENTYEYSTINRDPIKISNPYVTMMACCTTDWINNKLKQEVISDGLTRRIIFVHEEKRSKYIPRPSIRDKEAFDVMLSEALRIRAMVGQFEFTQDANEYWDKLYMDIQEFAEEQDIFLQHYYTTKHILMIKVAMCLSACLRKDKRIDKALLEIVKIMFEDFEKNLPKLFKATGRNEVLSIEDQLEEFIVEGGKSGRSTAECIEKMRRDVDMEECMDMLSSLITRERITAKSEGAKTRYFGRGRKLEVEQSNLFNVIKQYKPSTPESEITSYQPIELDRLVTKEQQAVIEKNSKLDENLKRGILLSRRPKKRI